MKLRVSRQEEGENHLSFESESSGWLKKLIDDARAQGFNIKEPLSAELWLTRSEPDCFLRGQLRFSIDQDCSRCAEHFALNVDHPFALVLARKQSTPAAKSKSDTTEDADELDVVFFEGDEVELDPIVQEQLVLSLPYKALCSVHCRGICQHCGVNRNTSNCACDEVNRISPFAVLAQLKPSHPRS